MERLGVLDVVELEREREELRAQIAQVETDLETKRAEAEAQRATANRELAELRQRVVVTEESAILQEVGVYEYSHP